MGSGGIIFLIILGVWALYLVPVILRELGERAQARAFDRESDSARVLQRPPADRDARRVVLTAGRPLVRDDLPARPAGEVAAALREGARRERRATRLRAVAALAGLVAVVVTTVAAGFTALPWWSVAVAGSWLGAVLAAGAVSAAARRRRGAPAISPVARPVTTRQVVRRATTVFDGRTGATQASVEPAAQAPQPEVDAPSRAGATVAVEAADAGWTPVSVPRPTYTAKTVSQRPPALPWSFPAVGPSAAEAAAATAAPVDVPAAGAHPGDLADERGDERHSAAG